MESGNGKNEILCVKNMSGVSREFNSGHLSRISGSRYTCKQLKRCTAFLRIGLPKTSGEGFEQSHFEVILATKFHVSDLLIK
jgi:hypothetical protein